MLSLFFSRRFLGPCLLFALLLVCPARLCANPTLHVTLLLEHDAKSTWSTALTQGLARAERDLGVRTTVVVEGDEEKQEAVFRAWAKRSDLVLVASDRFHEILRNNARAFPSVRFGCIDASIRSANVTCITFADEQAAFLAGYAAAAHTAKTVKESDKGRAVGWISGEEIPAMQSMFNGFREGAKLAEPNIRVIHGTTESFADPKRGAQEATRLLTEGVAVIVLAAGGSNPGILAEAKKAGILVVGLDTDQKDIYPGHVLTSIVKDIEGAVYRIIQETAAGAFRGKEIVVYDLAHGLAVIDPQRSLNKHSPLLATISRRLGELTRELSTGGIRLKSFRARTLCNCL